MLNINRKHSRGDTLVEVLFATAIFSLVAVGSLLIMNQGSATAQRALEITLARQEIDAQADALRYLNASYISAYQPGQTNYTGFAAEWRMIYNNLTNTISDFEDVAVNNGARWQCNIPNHGFILNARNVKLMDNNVGSIYKPTEARVYPQVIYKSNSDDIEDNASAFLGGSGPVQGIWIEAIRVSPNVANQNNAGYIDFHIRTCWDSPGQSIPVTLGTIVRLYEPKG